MSDWTNKLPKAAAALKSIPKVSTSSQLKKTTTFSTVRTPQPVRRQTTVTEWIKRPLQARLMKELAKYHRTSMSVTTTTTTTSTVKREGIKRKFIDLTTEDDMPELEPCD